MKELPVAMSNPMVLAIHREQSPKVVTRRIVQIQPPADCGRILCGEYHPTVVDRKGNQVPGKPSFGAYNEDGTWACRSPYGSPGTHLWLREAWRAERSLDHLSGVEIGEKAINAGYSKPWAPIQYEADQHRRDWVSNFAGTNTEPGRPRLARFMPRWASRTTLLVTGVRVERLHEITDDEAWDEGIDFEAYTAAGGCKDAPRAAYSALWERIHGANTWDLNPLVWVINFRRHEPRTEH